MIWFSDWARKQKGKTTCRWNHQFKGETILIKACYSSKRLYQYNEDDFRIDSFSWLLYVYVYPCCLTVWYKSKLQSKVVLIILIKLPNTVVYTYFTLQSNVTLMKPLFRYLETKVEHFAPYLLKDGLVLRVTKYQNNLENAEEVSDIWHVFLIQLSLIQFLTRMSLKKKLSLFVHF